MTRTEREKMLAGEGYMGFDPELLASRNKCRDLLARYNATTHRDADERAAVLRELLGGCEPGVWVEPPFFCDYGSYVFLGQGVYLNAGCVLLDCNTIHVGAATKFGPGVHIYTAHHPVDAALRRTGIEMATAVRIGENAWIGGGAIICPGVEIGDDTVVGAGSVVTRSIPPRVVAVGNPCRVIRQL